MLHLSEVAAAEYRIYWTFHPPPSLREASCRSWGTPSCHPRRLESYGRWQLRTWQASQTSCHCTPSPSHENGSCWGLISAWRPILLTGFNSLRAPFIMHCLSCAFNQTYCGILTSRPSRPGLLHAITYIHDSFIHEFVCFSCYVVLACALSVRDWQERGIQATPCGAGFVFGFFLSEKGITDWDYDKIMQKELRICKARLYFKVSHDCCVIFKRNQCDTKILGTVTLQVIKWRTTGRTLQKKQPVQINKM